MVPKSANEKIITRRKLPSGKEVTGTPIALGTDIQDPLERLYAVRAEIQNAKYTAESLGLNLFQGLLDNLPEAAGRALMRHALLPLLNVSASNVRGPEIPLYVAGARLLHFYPISIATDFVGLNMTGFSYNGVLWISVVACRNMMPDPGFFTQCLNHSFQDLLEAARFQAAIRAAAASSTSNVYSIGMAAARNPAKPKAAPAGKPASGKPRAAASATKAAPKAAPATAAKPAARKASKVGPADGRSSSMESLP
jgi:hypothetical protein